MSGRRHQSSTEGGDRRRSSREHQSNYILPSSTYAPGLGGGRDRDSSHQGSASGGSSSLGGIYDRYGRGFESDSSVRRSQRSDEGLPPYPNRNELQGHTNMRSGSQRQSTSTVFTRASQIVDPSRRPAFGPSGGSGDLLFHPGSVVGSSQSGASPRHSSVSGERLGQGRTVAMGSSASYAFQLQSQQQGQPVITYSETSRSFRARAKQIHVAQREEQRKRAGTNPLKKVLQRSKEVLEDITKRSNRKK